MSLWQYLLYNVNIMKLIIGLGNPGTKYDGTRHNVGFTLINALAKEWSGEFQDKPKFRAHIAEIVIEGERILLVKPTTFYNLTGESIRAIRDFYKLGNSDILVIHDDMALPFGTIRTRLSGSDAGNNGIKSLNQHLGDDYARIRVGIWSEHRENIDATDFVLGKLSAAEKEVVAKAVKELIEPICEDFATGDIQARTAKIETQD